MNETRPKRKKKIVRWLLYAMGLYLCLWAAVNAIFNIPAIRSSILTQIQSVSGIEIHRAGWILVGLTGNLSLSHIGIKTKLEDQEIEMAASIITFKYVGQSKPHLQIKNGSTPWGTVKRGDIDLTGEWSNPRFSVVIDRAELDGDAIILLGDDRDETSGTGEFQNPLQSLEVQNSSIRLSQWNDPIDFDLHFSLLDNEKAEAHVTLFSPQKKGSIRSAVQWKKFPLDIENVKGRFDAYPVSHLYAAAEGIVNGSYEITQNLNGQFVFAVSKSIQSASFTDINTGVFHTESLDIQGTGMLDERYVLQSAAVTINHENVRDRRSGLHIPAGAVALHFIHNSTAEQTASIQIESENLGRVSVSASGSLVNVTPEFKGKLVLSDLSIGSLLHHLPSEWLPQDLNVSAIASASGTYEIEDFKLQQHDLNFQIHDIQTEYTGISLAQASIRGNAAGDNTQHEASLQIEPGVMAYTDEVQNIVLPLDPFSVDVKFHSDFSQYQVETSPVHSDWWDELLVSYTTENQLKASVSTTTEKLLQPLFAHAIPFVTRAFDGTGDITIALESDLTQHTIRAKSEDIALFSFEEPYIGLQVRNVDAAAAVDFNNQSMPLRVTIDAATPYVLYGDFELEMPGDAFRVQASVDADYTQYQAALHVPNDGLIHTTYFQSGGYLVAWEKLDLHSMIVPAIHSYMQTEMEMLASLQGNTSGRLQQHVDDGGVLNGSTELHIKKWRRNEVPAVGVQNATITLPFAYPLEVEHFFPKDIVFDAEAVLWGEEVYTDVKQVLPISDEAVSLPALIDLPLFGGQLIAENVSFTDWKNGYPTIVGDIQLINIKMEQASAIVPYLGNEGTLTLHASEIVWQGDRFALQGSLAWHAFSGTIAIQDVYYQPETLQLGLSMYFIDVDLEPLSRYFRYGKITGKLSGHIRDLVVQFPEPGEGSIPKPVAFDLELNSNSKREQIVSGRTLKKLMELGNTTVPFQQELYSRDFKYAGLGLRGIHSATQTRIYGTLEDNYFIAPSTGLFANKVGIRMQVAQNSNRLSNIDFDRIWKTLLDQVE